MSLADEENVQPLLSEQDVETGEDREAPPHVTEEPETPAQEGEEEPDGDNGAGGDDAS